MVNCKYKTSKQPWSTTSAHPTLKWCFVFFWTMHDDEQWTKTLLVQRNHFFFFFATNNATRPQIMQKTVHTGERYTTKSPHSDMLHSPPVPRKKCSARQCKVHVAWWTRMRLNIDKHGVDANPHSRHKQNCLQWLRHRLSRMKWNKALCNKRWKAPFSSF